MGGRLGGGGGGGVRQAQRVSEGGDQVASRSMVLQQRATPPGAHRLERAIRVGWLTLPPPEAQTSPSPAVQYGTINIPQMPRCILC